MHFLANKGGFDVGHDGENHSINLNLDSMIKTLNVLSIKDSINNHKIWLDFKNLDSNNKYLALNELLKICKQNNYKKENFIIESRDYESLKIFKNAGFYTSYYVTYYSQDDLANRKNKIITHLESVVNSDSVNALSFPYYLYDFMNNLDLNIDYLTWNEGQNKAQNMDNKAYKDSKIKVILAGERGNYR